MTSPFRAFLLSVCVLSLLCACHAGTSSTLSRSSEGPHLSGGQPGALKRYDAFYIPDIEVYSMEGDVLRRVSESEVEELAQVFRTKLMRQLGSKYTVFSQPARNVAKLRIALSDVSSTYALFQLYPGLLVPNAMRGGATIEAKFIDSVSGKEVLTFRDTRQGARQGFFSGLGKWDGVEKAFDEWAMQLSSATSR